MNGQGKIKITQPLLSLKRGLRFTCDQFQDGRRIRMSARCASVYRRNGITHIRFDSAVAFTWEMEAGGTHGGTAGGTEQKRIAFATLKRR
jgi:hypothetical protein